MNPILSRALLAASTFCMVLGIGIVAPVIPLFVTEWGISTAEAGVLIAAFAFGRLIFAMPGGYLADRFGRRPVAIAACCVVAVGAGLAVLADGYTPLLGAQALQGMGSVLFVTSATATVLAGSAPDTVGRSLAWYRGSVLVGMSVAPVIGGFAGAQLGLKGPFVVCLAAALVALALTLASFPRSQRESAHGSPDPAGEAAEQTGGLRDVWTSRAFLLGLLTGLVAFWVFAGVRSTLVPLYADAALGFGPVEIGVLLGAAAVTNVAFMLPAGHVLDRHGRRVVAIAAMFALATPVLAMAAGLGVFGLFAAMAVLGTAKAFIGNVPVVILTDVTTPDVRGLVVGIERTVTGLGLVLGPVAVGSMLLFLPFEAVFLVSGILVLAVAVALLRLPETRRVRTPA